MRVIAEETILAFTDLLLRRAVVLGPRRIGLRLRSIRTGFLHPERRAPRRRPDPERPVAAREDVLEEREERLAVALNGKLLEREVAGRLGIGIEVGGEVACADGRANHRERPSALRKHLVKYRLPVFLAKRGKRIPAELASAHAKPEHRLVDGGDIKFKVRIGDIGSLDGR